MIVFSNVSIFPLIFIIAVLYNNYNVGQYLSEGKLKVPSVSCTFF